MFLCFFTESYNFSAFLPVYLEEIIGAIMNPFRYRKCFYRRVVKESICLNITREQ